MGERKVLARQSGAGRRQRASNARGWHGLLALANRDALLAIVGSTRCLTHQHRTTGDGEDKKANNDSSGPATLISPVGNINYAVTFLIFMPAGVSELGHQELLGVPLACCRCSRRGS